MHPVYSLKPRPLLSISVLRSKTCRLPVFRLREFSTVATEDSNKTIHGNPDVNSHREPPLHFKLNLADPVEKTPDLRSDGFSSFLNHQPSKKQSRVPPNRTFERSRSSWTSLSKLQSSPPEPSSSPPNSNRWISNQTSSHSTSYQLSEPQSMISVDSRVISSSRAPSDKKTNTQSTSFTLTYPSLGIDRSKFSARWVRDSDVSLHSIDPSTRQKKHQSDETDPAVRLIDGDTTLHPITINSVSELKAIGETVAAELGPCLKFQWEGIGLPYLSSAKEEAPLIPKSVPWAASDLNNLKTLWTSYEEFKSTPQALHTVLRQLAIYGIAFIGNVPTDQTENESCELRNLANRVGELRHTFYGETWNVRSLGNQGRNVAYTDVPLGLHMDLLYFQNPPQLQFLHSLRARVKGGASYFVDSFRAAESLRQRKPDVFRKLTTAKVPYHYINDAHHLEHSHPIIELYPHPTRIVQNRAQSRENNRALGLQREIKHVNYSPPFQAPLQPDLNSSEETMNALTVFAKELSDPKLVFELTLKEGECVVFDNRRVLHARRGFKEIQDDRLQDGPQRWLKGCYVDGDAAWDRLRVLEGEKRRGEW